MICPNCFGTMKMEDGMKVCKKCGSSFAPGSEVLMPLGKALRLTTLRAKREKTLERSRRKKPSRSRKKTVPHKTGFWGVSRAHNLWKYQNQKKHIFFSDSDILKLRSKVVERGLKWEMVYRPSAQRTADMCNVSLSRLK